MNIVVTFARSVMCMCVEVCATKMAIIWRRESIRVRKRYVNNLSHVVGGLKTDWAGSLVRQIGAILLAASLQIGHQRAVL